jgi:hypothetical protein
VCFRAYPKHCAREKKGKIKNASFLLVSSTIIQSSTKSRMMGYAGHEAYMAEIRCIQNLSASLTE